MPSSLLYLGTMLAIICIWFIVVKRPVYEGVLLSFIVLVAITDTWTDIGSFIENALSTSLLYTMVAFVSMSIILTKTKIIDSCIGLILSVVGRITGGAGYTAVIASAFMGALSGSGPGNVMATGAMTIPAMKRSGFPAELAANIESNASYLGNMIPPSTNIAAAIGAYAVACPDNAVSDSHFMGILWMISLYFILQRLIMVFAFCKYYKVKPIPKEELPSFKETLKLGWKGLLLPVIIILPFVIDAMLKETFFTERLGAAGAKAFSSAILMSIGGIASIYACLAAKDRSTASLKSLISTFEKSVKSIAPAISVCLFGYMIGELFEHLNVTAELEAIITSLNFGKFTTVLIVCVITCFMGMVIPGSALVSTFGAMFIGILSNVGVNPILAASMLPCICGVMCGITPPMALGLYAGMSIAQSDFGKTVKNDLWWVAAQFILQVLVLMGWLPVFGL